MYKNYLNREAIRGYGKSIQSKRIGHQHEHEVVLGTGYSGVFCVSTIISAKTIVDGGMKVC